jgi:capsular polysaccharide export protein
MGEEAALHIIGTQTFHGFRNWRAMLRFNPEKIVAKHYLRRRIKHPYMARSIIMGWFYRQIVGLYERYRFASYVSLLTHVKPRHVGLWNGLKLPNETIVEAAQALGIPVIYFENGLLPGTCSIDPQGVNQAASLPRNPSFYLNYVFSESARPIKPLQPRKPIRSRKKENPISLPERYIFVPFQVPDDTQIICHSPWIKSMEMLYQVVMTALELLPDADLQVVFKEHPSWPGHFEHLYRLHPRARFANGNPTPELIANSEALITINSTVGLEGVQLKKKVIVLGKTCYRIPGLVLKADGQEELNACMSVLADWQFDYQLREQYLRYLNEVYCIPQNWSMAGEENIDAAVARITARDEFSRSIDKSTNAEQQITDSNAYLLPFCSSG